MASRLNPDPNEDLVPLYSVVRQAQAEVGPLARGQIDNATIRRMASDGLIRVARPGRAGQYALVDPAERERVYQICKFALLTGFGAYLVAKLYREDPDFLKGLVAGAAVAAGLAQASDANSADVASKADVSR